MKEVTEISGLGKLAILFFNGYSLYLIVRNWP